VVVRLVLANLRGQIVRRPHRGGRERGRARQHLAHAKVPQSQRPVRGDEDVLRLQIPAKKRAHEETKRNVVRMSVMNDDGRADYEYSPVKHLAVVDVFQPEEQLREHVHDAALGQRRGALSFRKLIGRRVGQFRVRDEV